MTPRFVAVRESIIGVLTEEAGELRLMEIRRQVEERLGESLDARRFKNYVNDQSRGRKAVLERTGYGLYRLRHSTASSQPSDSSAHVICR